MKTARLVGILSLSLSAALWAPSAAAQVDVNDPVATAPVDANVLTALPTATGDLPDAPPAVQSQYVVHEDQFTWAADLLTLTVPTESDWLTSLEPTPGTGLEFSCSGAFKGHLEDALAAGTTALEGFNQGYLEDAVSAFNAFTGGGAVVLGGGAPDFIGYKPIRARWLKSRWTGSFPGVPEQKRVYPNVFAFEDIRLRGARLYCAARRAQAEQGSSVLSMGERPSFSISVLSQTIDFLVVGSTMAFNGPERFLGASGPGAPSDGAQAFTVPMLFGTRITPIRGIPLPGFGEIRVPVVLLSGDSEVKTAWDKRSVLLGYNLVCNPLPCRLVPVRQTMHSKESHTVTHAGALRTKSIGVAADAKIPIFFVGPAVFYLTLGLTYDVGAVEQDPGRLLTPFPQVPAREGQLFTHLDTSYRYHDGPWTITPSAGGTVPGAAALRWTVLPNGATDVFWREPLFPLLQPHDIRAATNDDRGLTSSVSASLTAGLQGVLGITAGPFDVSLTASGAFTGSASQGYHVRDALMAQDPLSSAEGMRPVTAVSVRPESEAKVAFDGLTATLHFELELFFDTIQFDKQLFKVGAFDIADYESKKHLSDADEAFTLRLGTGGAAGQRMKKPTVLSHLPEGNEFNTFDQAVATCLADDTPNPPIEPECPAEDPTGTTPSANICLVGPNPNVQRTILGLPVPQGVCTNVAGYVGSLGLDNARSACFVDYVSFLCSGTTKTQKLPNTNTFVVSRVWNFDVPMSETLGGILNGCAAAFLNPPGSTDTAKALVADLVTPLACDADATLIPDDEILKPIDPTLPPPVKPGPICQD